MLKIGLVGYGSMGRLIHQICRDQDIAVTGIIDPFAREAHFDVINEESLALADIWIDFTLPSTIHDNIRSYQSFGADAVIGTTGWYNDITAVKKATTAAGHKLIYASNFAIGVNLFFAITEFAAKVMNKIDGYDVWAHELHHNNKADSPSGTAKSLSDILLANLDKKDKAVYEMLDRKIKPDEMHFASIRGGQNNFEHHISFGSDHDRITLSHASSNRDGYAKGAIEAAKWLHGQVPGFYTLKDFIQSIIGNGI